MRVPNGTWFLCAVAVAACGPAIDPYAPASLDAVNLPVVAGKPAAPTHLYASLSKGDAVLLSWTDHATNETGFLIQRMQQLNQLEAIGGIWNQAGAVGPDVTTFIDDHVVGGVTYTYRVAAFNAAGYSDWSNLAVAQVPIGVVPPEAPSGLTARLDVDGVHLSWVDHSDGQAAFELERSVVEGRWIGIAKTWPAVTTFVASPVLAGEASFRVRAFNAAGASAWSNVAAAQLPMLTAAEAPAAPTELFLMVIDGSTRLIWRDNSLDETGFKIERLHLSYFQPLWEPVAVTERNATVFVDEARPPGTLAYRVCATNAAGDSAWLTEFIALAGQGGGGCKR